MFLSFVVDSFGILVILSICIHLTRMMRIICKYEILGWKLVLKNHSSQWFCLWAKCNLFLHPSQYGLHFWIRTIQFLTKECEFSSFEKFQFSWFCFCMVNEFDLFHFIRIMVKRNTISPVKGALPYWSDNLWLNKITVYHHTGCFLRWIKTGSISCIALRQNWLSAYDSCRKNSASSNFLWRS